MSGRLAWDVEQLRSHADRVGQVGDDVALASDAAKSVDLGGGAFGVLCAFMILPVAAVSSIATGMIDSAGRMLERTRTELVAMAGDVEGNENDLRALITGLATEVDNAPGASR